MPVTHKSDAEHFYITGYTVPPPTRPPPTPYSGQHPPPGSHQSQNESHQYQGAPLGSHGNQAGGREDRPSHPPRPPPQLQVSVRCCQVTQLK